MIQGATRTTVRSPRVARASQPWAERFIQSLRDWRAEGSTPYGRSVCVVRMRAFSTKVVRVA
jgi:hypothetical protein